jgi:hypothetical protein
MQRNLGLKTIVEPIEYRIFFGKTTVGRLISVKVDREEGH